MIDAIKEALIRELKEVETAEPGDTRPDVGCYQRMHFMLTTHTLVRTMKRNIIKHYLHIDACKGINRKKNSSTAKIQSSNAYKDTTADQIFLYY